MLDYETLRIIWWLLLGALLAGFAIMDGFDLGIGMLLLGVAKTNAERRVVLNTIGPVWEGNQIWLVLGAGAIFAAWPAIYAVTFSGFYFAMLLVLLALILRPLGFKYRSKIDHTGWRNLWDGCIFSAGLVPALIFGVAIGNVLQGVPFYFDDSLRSFYTGNLMGLLNPFGIFCGIVSICMLIMHGGIFLSGKTEGAIRQRAKNYARLFGLLFVGLFIAGGFWVQHHLTGYVLSSALSPDGPSNPLYKTVGREMGAWLNNYAAHPILKLAPLTGIISALLAIILLSVNLNRLAWWCSALSIGGVIATVGASLFPFILPSSTNPNMSLLVWDSSSSQTTLMIMLFATVLFLPLILIYTSWVYYVLRGKVTENDVNKNSQAY